MAGILLAGFGGQGILFAGKQLIVAGMKNGKEVSWLQNSARHLYQWEETSE